MLATHDEPEALADAVLLLNGCDKYAAVREEAALHSFAASQPWTMIADSSHCARLHVSSIPKYR